MTEVFFYHLEHQSLDRILPRLLQASISRGWRVVVQTGSAERAEALSASLWTSDEEGFLPHGSKADGNAELQPIWLTETDETPNGANVRFFVDGAAVDKVERLTRAVIIFDGADGEAVERAREDWKSLRRAGHDISYWQQDENGRWQNRAAG
ncbi:MAG: DNA polymerase III subunit chi [Alphaproteobacteria bacterium]|nr:DNA polymerase III subunit chi [Alphaproteobacteria bacterium]